MIKKILFPVYLVGCICLMTFFTLNTSSAQSVLTKACEGGSSTVTCKDQENAGGPFRQRLCATCAWEDTMAGASGTCTFCL